MPSMHVKDGESALEEPQSPVEHPVQEPAEQPMLQGHENAGVRSWARDLVVSILVSVFIILFLYQPVRVEGTSMLPMLEDQDRLFINKFAYSRLGSLVGDQIHRGDVVVFLYPLHQARDRSPRRPPENRPRDGLGQRRAAERELRPIQVPGRPLPAGDDDSRQRVLHDGRPPLDLKRQPRLRSRGSRLDLRPRRLRLLADGSSRCRPLKTTHSGRSWRSSRDPDSRPQPARRQSPPPASAH